MEPTIPIFVDSREQPQSARPLNLCTSTLPGLGFGECLKVAKAAGYQGLALRVHDDYHVTLPRLAAQCEHIRREIEGHELDLKAYDTHLGVTDTASLDAMLRICQRTNVRYFRVTAPLAGPGAMSRQSSETASVPGYRHDARPKEVLRTLRRGLEHLAARATAYRVTALLELHWGTVMSSFTSAHQLLADFDPMAIGVTFDPANMVIEGREDWHYGIELLRERIANVQIRNVAWTRRSGRWQWSWDGLGTGMVDWPEVLGLLADMEYRGMFAMADGRAPRGYAEALRHLTGLRREAGSLLLNARSRRVA